MGIEGLLKLIDPITIRQHISSFQYKTVVIDIMSWIYKGCYRCAFELNQNIESNNFLYYIFEMIDLLTYYKIKPICIFDGRYVGKKDDTIDKRKKTKQENKQRGLDYLKIGNQQMARKYLSRCIIIDQRIIATTMRAFHTKNIQFMVAPYQSDSQIAKLIQMGIADLAISQDSDLVIYGIKVVMKLNQDGDCNYVDLSKWKPEDVDSFFLKQFLKMDHIQRIQSAVLSGTDYNDSVKGIGIKKAVKHLAKSKTMNAVIENLRQVKPFKDRVPQNYEKIVLDSKLIFLFATVYNPFQMKLQYLNPHLLSEILPQSMSQQQLINIVGKHYAYDEEVKKGNISARNLQKRQIFNIDIKTIFSLNSGSLASKEIANKQRRIDQIQLKKRRQEQIKIMTENGQIDTNGIIKKQKNKKSTAQANQMTDEQKKLKSEQKKAERQKKFQQFKNLLNNFVDFESDSESSSESESISNDSPPPVQISNNKPSIQNKRTEQKEKQSLEEESQSQSVDLCLKSLNPWAKQSQPS